jgi:dTDP-4-dehydrorhamnose 3,5-epimerase
MSQPSRSTIEGVRVRELEQHSDERGDLVELFRERWFDGFEPVQWNSIRSDGNVLRGFHCHLRHTDLLALIGGTMTMGLMDLRHDSPTSGRSEVMTLRAAGEAVLIPPGVGHGFYFPEPAILMHSVSHEWDAADELACNWADPALGIEWGCVAPRLSARDRTAGSLDELRAEVRAAL